MSFSQRGGQLGCCRGWGAAGAGSSTGFWPQVKTSADGKRVPFFCANPGGSRSPLGTAACCQTPACRGRRDPNPFQRRFGTAQDSRNVLSTGKPGWDNHIPHPPDPCTPEPLQDRTPAPPDPCHPAFGRGKPPGQESAAGLAVQRAADGVIPDVGVPHPNFSPFLHADGVTGGQLLSSLAVSNLCR